MIASFQAGLGKKKKAKGARSKARAQQKRDKAELQRIIERGGGSNSGYSGSNSYGNDNNGSYPKGSF